MKDEMTDTPTDDIVERLEATMLTSQNKANKGSSVIVKKSDIEQAISRLRFQHQEIADKDGEIGLQFRVPVKFFLNTIRDFNGVLLRENWSIYYHSNHATEKAGFILYEIVSTHTPPNHNERVFYTRTYIHPDETRHTSSKLYCVTRKTFAGLTHKALGQQNCV